MPTTPEYTVEDETTYLPENSADLAAITKLQEDLNTTNKKLDAHIEDATAFKKEYHTQVDKLEQEDARINGRLDQYAIDMDEETDDLWRAINGIKDTLNTKVGKDELYTVEDMENQKVLEGDEANETAVSFSALQAVAVALDGTMSGIQESVTQLAGQLDTTNQSIVALDKKISGNIETVKTELVATDVALSGAIDALTTTVAENKTEADAKFEEVYTTISGVKTELDTKDLQLAEAVKTTNDNIVAAKSAVTQMVVQLATSIETLSGSIETTATEIANNVVSGAVLTLVTKDEVNELKANALAKYETLSGHIDVRYQELKDLIHEYHPEGIPVIKPGEDGTLPQIPTHIERPDAPVKPESDFNAADNWIVDDINWQLDAVVTQVNANFGQVENRLDDLDAKVATNIETFTTGIAAANDKIVEVSGAVNSVEILVNGATERVTTVETAISGINSTIINISGAVNKIPTIETKLEEKMDKANVYTVEDYRKNIESGLGLSEEEYATKVPSEGLVEFFMQGVNSKLDVVSKTLEDVVGTDEKDGALVIIHNKVTAVEEKALANETAIADTGATVAELVTKTDATDAVVQKHSTDIAVTNAKLDALIGAIGEYLIKMSELEKGSAAQADETLNFLKTLIVPSN